MYKSPFSSRSLGTLFVVLVVSGSRSAVGQANFKQVPITSLVGKSLAEIEAKIGKSAEGSSSNDRQVERVFKMKGFRVVSLKFTKKFVDGKYELFTPESLAASSPDLWTLILADTKGDYKQYLSNLGLSAAGLKFVTEEDEGLAVKNIKGMPKGWTLVLYGSGNLHKKVLGVNIHRTGE